MQLDLRTDAGRAILLKLLARADILLENYRAGVMERLGLGRRRAQGHQPPADPLLDHRVRRVRALQRAAGLRQRRGWRSAASRACCSIPEQPQVSGPTITDNATGMYACYGILGALYERERSGRGRRVEVNMLEAAHRLHPRPVRELHPRGHRQRPADPGRQPRSRSRSAAATASCSPSNSRRSRSSWKGCWRRSSGPTCWTTRGSHPRPADQQLRRIEPRAGRDHRDQAPRPLDERARSERRAVRAGQQPRGRARRPAGAASANVLPAAHPTEGEITAIHRPVLIDGARDERALPAPTLGEHTDAVLAELGYDEGEIGKLRAASVI